jgi:hypothetical protein
MKAVVGSSNSSWQRTTVSTAVDADSRLPPPPLLLVVARELLADNGVDANMIFEEIRP